jgi:protein ATS1
MRLFAAGSNAKGQLATGDDEDAHRFRPCKFLVAGKEVEEVPGNNIVKVVAGANHSIALLENPATLQRSLWGAGDGSNGQLGPRIRHSTGPHHVYHPLDIPLPNEKVLNRDVCAAWETSFIRVRDGTTHSDYILSFGSNDHGVLGVAPGVTPLDVNTVDFTSTEYEGTEVVLFTTGARTAYAVMKDLRVAQARRILVGWGASRHGQMTVTSGGPDTTQAKHPISTPIPQVIELPQDDEVESIAGGFQHALILTTSGRLLGLGSNKKGQLDVSTSVIPEVGNPSSIGATWNSSFILDESRRTFFACGSNNHGQLGGVLDHQSLATVSLPDGFVVDSWVCGSEHVLVLARSVRIHL